MPMDAVEKIANAVLYEGYILYPYRADAVKNRQRFNFGAVYPSAHRQAQTGADIDTMEIECLVSRGARFRTTSKPTPGSRRGFDSCNCRPARFFARFCPAEELVDPAVEPKYEPVDSLIIDGHVHQTWQEAVERDIVIADLLVADLMARPTIHPFSLPASWLAEPLTNTEGKILGRVVRRQHEISGVATFAAETLERPTWCGCVWSSTIPRRSPRRRWEVGMRCCLAHSSRRTRCCEWPAASSFRCSSPPEPFCAAAAECRNVGAWPVLAGEAGQRDRLLASPIILYDYPQVAPESSGDWCDGGEIDEMLVLRVMTLTGDEKRAMRDVDRRAREILERTESMTEDQMLKLHGAFRGLERSDAPVDR